MQTEAVRPSVYTAQVNDRTIQFVRHVFAVAKKVPAQCVSMRTCFVRPVADRTYKSVRHEIA